MAMMMTKHTRTLGTLLTPRCHRFSADWSSDDSNGWAEFPISEASTDSCSSESSYRLVRSRRELEEVHDEVLFSIMSKMFNRNRL